MNTKKIFLSVSFLFILTNTSFAFNMDLFGINGQKTNIANFKGKIVVATFFDVNCYYCQLEVPTLNKLYKAYGENKKNVIIIGVDPFDQLKEIKEFGQYMDVKYPLYWGNYNQTYPMGGIMGTPTTIFINKKGKIKLKVPGETSRTDFITNIASIK